MDLDPSLPPITQRIHGDPDLFSPTVKPNRDRNSLYIKPIVVRPSSGIRFRPGNHGVEGNVKISPEFYLGAHWQMADPSIALDRRLKNRARMSERNKAQGMGSQHYYVTEEWIKAECDRHLDDPVIQALCPADDQSPVEIAALRSKLFMQEAATALLRKQIRELNEQMQGIKNENAVITGSLTWSVVGIIFRCIDVLFPPNTGRRLRFNRVFAALRGRRHSINIR